MIQLRHDGDGSTSAVISVSTLGPTLANAFLEQRLIQDAVVRNLVVVGEAARALDDATRSLAPDMPWRRIASMRDSLTQRYFAVDLDMVWSVVDTEVSSLLALRSHPRT